MITKTVFLPSIDTGSLEFGRVGENNHIRFDIRCDSVFDDYPNAEVSVLIKAPSGEVYPKVIDVDSPSVYLVVASSDVASEGSGSLQMTFTDSGEVVKTVIASTFVLPSLIASGEAPDPISTWVEEANAVVQNAADEWLEENITNPDSPPLDRSLSSSSAAAPADVVGAINDAISVSVRNILTWARGGLNSSNGEATNSNKNKRCRTTVRDIEDISIQTDGDSQVYGYFYAGDSFLGNTGAWRTELNPKKYAETNYPTATKYRVLGRLSTDGQIGDGTSDDVSECTKHIVEYVPYVIADDIKFDLKYVSTLPKTTDFNGITFGVHQVVAGDTGTAETYHRPTLYGGVIITSVPDAADRISQIYISTNNDMFFRIYASNTWAEWRKSNYNSLTYGGSLAATTDFNTITFGMYQAVRLSSGIAADYHRPSVVSGTLFAYPSPLDDPLRVTQIFTSTGNSVFIRSKYDGVWTEWEKLNNGGPDTNNWGVENVKASASQIMDIKWTPVGNMPSVLTSSANVDPITYFTQTEQTGIPYSSTRYQDKAVGMDVSIHTFMTAVKDPNSVLYTRRSVCRNSSTYYGTVCSGLVNYSFGFNLNLTNYFLAEWNEFETIPMMAIVPGDMLWVDGHVALVSDVGFDTFGRINKVVIWEEWRPLPRKVTYNSWSAFISGRGDYIARRYKHIDGVGYTPIPYVQCYDEQLSTIVYPDVQTDHGDAAVFMVGNTVNVHVLNASDFTTITVKKGDTVIHTTNTIADFSLSSLAGGLYTITANGGSNESVSTFFIVDATASFDPDTGVVTFSSTNAIPAAVNVYDLPSNMNITNRTVILTDADRTAGQVNVSDQMDTTHIYAKVTFMTDYGSAVWYSENNPKWVAIT